jgi:hypothetical protein
VRLALWALSNLARGADTPAAPFFEAGIGDHLVRLLDPALAVEVGGGEAPDIALITEAAWVVTFLSAREEEYVKYTLYARWCAFWERGVLALFQG